MAYKIAAFLITLIVNLVIGAVVFFMMLIAMNGYSESDAEWGLITYIVMAVVTAILMSVGAVVLVRVLLNRQFSAIASVLIAIPTLSVIGAIVSVLCSLIGIGIAEYVRINY